MDRARQLWAAVAGVVVLVGAGVRAAEIPLGPADVIALEQPRVSFGLEDPARPGVLLGPEFGFGVLDTGASGILLAAAGYINGEVYPLETRGDGSVVTYEEIGTAGTADLDVFKPVNLYYQTEGEDEPRVINAVRPFGSADVDLGPIAGLVGMPAMIGKVVRMDITPIANLDFIATTFHTTRPAPTATSWHVPMTYYPVEFPGQEQPTDPLPTFAPVPLVPGVVHTHGANSTPLTMLLDTGAQTSIISTAAALGLGYNLDPDDPNTDIADLDGDGVITEADFIPVGGLGGTVPAPFIRIDRIAIPTSEGDTLVFENLDVVVIDIAGLDAIFGMNLLTTGYGFLFPEDGNPEDIDFGRVGAFEQVYFDFTSTDSAVMRLDVNPAFLVGVPEPGAGVGVLGLAGTAMLRRRRRRLATV